MMAFYYSAKEQMNSIYSDTPVLYQCTRCFRYDWGVIPKTCHTWTERKKQHVYDGYNGFICCKIGSRGQVEWVTAVGNVSLP